MSRRAQENLIALLLLALFGGVIWLCQDFGPRARMIPLPLAVFGIILTLIQLAWQNLRSLDELQMDMITVSRPLPAAEVQPGPDPSPAPKATWQRELGALGIVALLIALVFAIGVIPAVFVFTAGYFRLSGYYGWVASLAYTSAFTLVIHLLFIVALQVPPYYGLLAPLIERLH